MCHMLLLLLLAALNPESTLLDSTGLRFSVVFPENIAYYHPTISQNKLQITALYNQTKVFIGNNSTDMNSGDTKEYDVDASLELSKANIFNSTLQITSNKQITVVAISCRKNSVQTALVMPVDQLGTSYLIPPIPNIPGTTGNDVTVNVTERAPFRLIIVNTDMANLVTVGEQTVQLQPNQTAQIWLQSNDRKVSAQKPVAVLFGHSCAMRENCSCGLLYTPLTPAQSGQHKFIIPPVLSANDNTFLLQSDSNSISPFSPSIESTDMVVLYHPGLLLPLVAESDFASCFVAKSISNMQTHVVILVDQDYKDGVYEGEVHLPSPEWTMLPDTNYVWTVVDVWNRHIFWHNSHTMAVYFGGTKESGLFGNPAPIISRSADYRGCVLTPENLVIGDAAIGWPDSVQYCKNKTMELISISNSQFQTQVYQKILQNKSSSVQDLWVGMRRRSQTGEWYWLNNDPVGATDWAPGEPGDVDAGQCVVVSQNYESFSWRDEDCCYAAYPVCYRNPVLLDL